MEGRRGPRLDEIRDRSGDARKDGAWEWERGSPGREGKTNVRKWEWERGRRGRAGEEVKRGEKIRLLSFCLSVSLHPAQPHMALPRTEICPVLKALYHLVQTLNINQYSSYFIFSFVPWAASFNNAVMWPTGTHTDHNMIVQMYTESIAFIYVRTSAHKNSLSQYPLPIRMYALVTHPHR